MVRYRRNYRANADLYRKKSRIYSRNFLGTFLYFVFFLPYGTSGLPGPGWNPCSVIVKIKNFKQLVPEALAVQLW